MWIRDFKQDKIINLNNASYVEVAQFPEGKSSSWCVVAVFLMEYGHSLSINNTHVIIRQAKDNDGISQGLMMDELADIERQIGQKIPVYEPAT